MKLSSVKPKIAFSPREIVENARRRAVQSVWKLLLFAIIFSLATFFGFYNGSVFDLYNGTMRYPDAGRHSVVFDIIICIGLGMCLLFREYIRANQDYRKARDLAARNQLTQETIFKKEMHGASDDESSK
jgi:hypothetical protein